MQLDNEIGDIQESLVKRSEAARILTTRLSGPPVADIRAVTVCHAGLQSQEPVKIIYLGS